MSTRTKTETVTFTRPFRIRRSDRELQAGDYQIETDEELIAGLPTLSYRRVEVRLFIPRFAGVSEAEMWVLGVREFDDALFADQDAPAQRIFESGPITETRPVFHRAEASRREVHAPCRPKGENTPLYGTLLGILALMITGVVLGRIDLTSRSAQESVMEALPARE